MKIGDREVHDRTRRAIMQSVFSPDLPDDADQLQGCWGVPIALEMFHERLISPIDFFELCQEAAGAACRVLGRKSDVVPPSSRAA
jgi:hypothetical protein